MEKYEPRVTVGSVPFDDKADDPYYQGWFWDSATKKLYRWQDLPKNNS
jgi:hypothetical protein